MSVNGTITPTNWTDPTLNPGETAVRTAHINELRTAIQNLANEAPNVTNCGYAVCQSCQTNTNCCQTQCTYTCQVYTNCTCQACQFQCTCQSQCAQCNCNCCNDCCGG